MVLQTQSQKEVHQREVQALMVLVAAVAVLASEVGLWTYTGRAAG